MLGNSIEGQEIKDLWLEYENSETNEAILVKEIDKLEMCIQAFEYEKRHSIDLGEFYESCKDSFKHPSIVQLIDQIMKDREIK